VLMVRPPSNMASAASVAVCNRTDQYSFSVQQRHCWIIVRRSTPARFWCRRMGRDCFMAGTRLAGY